MAVTLLPDLSDRVQHTANTLALSRAHMAQRYYNETRTLRSFKCDKPSIDFVFIHGIDGDNSDSYWGRIGSFLDVDPKFKDTNIHFWSYPTTKSLKYELLSYFNGKRLPDFDVIARSLDTEICNISDTKERPFVLIGHSLGGVIAMRYVSEYALRRSKSNLRSMIMLGSPFSAPLPARAYNILTGGANVQIKSVSRSKPLIDLLINGVSRCREQNIKTVYVEADQDALVRYQEIYRVFDQRETVTGEHTWMPSVQNTQNNGYQTLTRLLRDFRSPAAARID